LSENRGRLVAFEGVEGSGKSTQARLLAADLGATLTREPGGTDIGARLRAILVDTGSAALDWRAEALVVLADRAQHVAEVVRPALVKGDDVITDRFTASTLAYQGFGRGLEGDDLLRLSAWAAAGLEPDLNVLLDVRPERGRSRIARVLDRMESEDDEFHERVATGYRSLAGADPDRWVVVDGDGTVEEVAARVRTAFDQRMPRR